MLAVTGGKGGVGRTTTALGVAAALARAGHRPLVVDADRRVPDLHAVAGVDASPGVSALAAGRDAGHRALAPGLDVVPARPDAPREDLRAALARLASGDRPVVVDCPAGAGPAAALPLRFADRALVVATPRAAAIRDGAKSGAMARALDAEVVGTVLTRAASPDPRADAVDRPILGCAPAAAAPLADGRVQSAHEAVVEALERQNA